MMRRWFLAVILALVAALPARAFDHGTVDIDSATTGTHHFTVEIARTDDDQAQGLMFRTTLAPDAGMLFVYPVPHEVMMWMKNTLIPLDMLFVRADGTIARIAARTVPQSLATISGGTAIAAVLELASGTADRLALKAGDHVRFASVDGAPSVR